MSSGRALLSCSLCRQRKLKCDRNVPCSNCIARKASCVFAPQARHQNRVLGMRTEAKHQVDARLRRLEQLVNSMTSPVSQTSPVNVTEYDEQPGAALSDVQKPSVAIESGRIVTNSQQTVYVSGAHWASICYEVADIREHFDHADSAEPATILETSSPDGPLLLDGYEMPPDLDSILSDIPPQDIANKLVAGYFNSAEFPSVILHTPTFDQEYRDFWLEPEKAPIPWLGLLFSLMTMGAFSYSRSEEGLPHALGPPQEAMTAFHRRATQCLALSKYFSSPGPYTIEALLVNLQFEFLRSKDARLGVWLMGGVVIRLALRMGYHRDPDAYPRISVFQGEMRRRIWSLIVQLDALTSYQMGLPPMIQDLHCDAKPPRNLLDEDFGPESTLLPISRPESEFTPMLFLIDKSKLAICFREIFSRVLLGGTEDYAKIMMLHQRLHKARDSISPRLRPGLPQDTVTVSPHLLLRRYNLELLFQKCVCILHRRHMTKAFTDPAFAMSRSLCVEAAMRILAIQSDLFDEDKHGYILLKSKGFISSLELSDFILAATIICLELSSGSAQLVSSQDQGRHSFTRKDFLDALHDSHRHLANLKDVSVDCQQAYEIVSIMVHKSSLLESSRESEQESNGISSYTTKVYHQPTGEEPTPSKRELTATRYSASTQETSAQTTIAGDPYPQTIPDPFSPSFDIQNIDGLDSFFSDPTCADWELWESFIRNPNSSADT